MPPATRGSKEAKAAANEASIADSTKSTKATSENPVTTETADSKATQPLGPPPRPQQSNGESTDYFNEVHNPNGNGGSYQAEPNPFEAQFSNPADTPGSKLLPSVASLTSPSSLLPTDTPQWNNSLRSGPLSPAMLAGPASGDYFSESFRVGLITPNESGLRTGLTPGGTGSMFPAASPSAGGLFNQLSLATPNTIDFIRTGVSARNATNPVGPTSQPVEAQTTQGIDLALPPPPLPTTTTGSVGTIMHADADAANGLFMLAQSNGHRVGQVQFTAQPMTVPLTSASPIDATPAPDQTNPTHKNSIGSTTLQGESSDSEQSEPPPAATKPATRGRGRKGAVENGKGNSRRKADGPPPRTPNNKRQKTGAAPQEKQPESSPADEGSIGKDGKKMTDEEKRKNFLERNRVAALKCRQRKKQWLSNLQTKVDVYSQENDSLNTQVNQLREENLTMKQLLLQHKSCNVTIASGHTPQTFMQFVAREPPPQQQTTLLPAYMSHTGVNGVTGQLPPGAIPLMAVSADHRAGAMPLPNVRS